MVGSDHQDRGVLEQLGQSELGRIEPAPFVVPQQRQVDRAVLQPIHQLALASAADVEPDLRVQLPEPPHDQREERAGHGREGAEHDLAPAQAGDLVEIGLRGVQLPEDLAGMDGEHQPRLRGHHAPGVASHQWLPHVVFQAPQLLRDR